MMSVDLNKLISDMIEMNNQVFLQHRYARIDEAYEAKAAKLAQQLEMYDLDGSIFQQAKAACSAFIADELKKHPARSIDPYADIGPEPFSEPIAPEEIRALDPEDVLVSWAK